MNDVLEGIHELATCCEEPGLWTIESLQVRRTKRRWMTKSGYLSKPRISWVIVWEPGERSEYVHTLREAKAKIVDAINGIGPHADVFR